MDLRIKLKVCDYCDSVYGYRETFLTTLTPNLEYLARIAPN